jgi:hypothetical protein
MELTYSNFSSEKRNENIETGNGNSIVQNGNKKGIFFMEAEMKTERHFLEEKTRKWNFYFQLMHNLCFIAVLHG